MIKDLHLYQIGSISDNFHLFNTENLSYDPKGQSKLGIVNSPIGDGSIDIIGAGANYKEDYTFEINFQLFDVTRDKTGFDNNNIEIILALLRNGMFPIYFLKEEQDGLYTILFNYAKCISFPTQGLQTSSKQGYSVRKYTCEVRLMRPYLYQINTDDVSTVNISTLVSSLRFIDGSWALNSGVTLNSTASAYTNTSNLSKDTWLTKYVNTDIDSPRKLPFDLTDRYFARNVPNTNTGSFVDVYSVATGTTIQTNNINLVSNAKNTIYLIKIPILTQSQFITLDNQSNTSGITITWLHTSPNNNPMVYNSVYNRLIDSLTNQIIDKRYYSIQRSGSAFFYFSAYRTNDQIRRLRTNTYNPDTDFIKVTHNIGGSIALTLSSLTVFH
jgi:hypothetical protein